MNGISRISAIIFIILLTAGGFWVYQSKYYSKLCRSIGGKWAGANHQCVTKWCYKLGSCGQWPNPQSRCDQLSIGNSIEKVYFVLGDPDKIDGNTFKWKEKNSNEIKVSAIIQNERLKVLICAN